MQNTQSQQDKQYQIDLLTAMNEKLMVSERAHRLACEFTGDGFIYYDLKKSKRVELIGAWEALTGRKLNGKPYDEAYLISLISEDDQKALYDNIINLEKTGKISGSCEVKSKSGKVYLKASAKVFYDKDNNPLEKIVIFEDVTKLRRSNEEMEYYAYHDILTGLSNRNYFVANTRDLIKRAEEENTSIELMLVDIDDFKKINDSLGLLYGDELVQEFGLYLKEFEGEDVYVARYGSDVFCIAVYNPIGIKSCDAIFKSIKSRLKSPFILTTGAEITISTTAGVTEFPSGGSNALDLIKNAEIVLYNTKEKERGGISFYNEDILSKFNNEIMLESRLKDAIENEEFEVYFQPIYDTESGKMRGAEALLRWPDETGGFVCPPDIFISLAEKNGTIVTIGNYVIKEVFRSLSEWTKKYHTDFIASINISPLQFKRPDFIDVVSKYLDLYELDPHLVEFEITESVFMDDVTVALETLKALRQIGVRVSLDDFGTGFSSLSYLMDLPISTLKIDKSFIDNICSDDKTATITNSVVDMVKKLSLETVAEGVEDKDQYEFLKQIKCDNIQGYLLSKPVPKTEFEKIIIRQLPYYEN